MTATQLRPPAVVFEHAGKSYGKVRAVTDLSLALHPGETVALLGPNGAGKSTTLDLLLGLRAPDTGTVRVFGTSPREAIVSGRVGAMLQSGGLMEEVTVRELVALACDLHPRPHPVNRVLAHAGLTAVADRRVDRLSGGQEQRVRFALATAGACDLVVLDEPTTGMDVSSRQSFWATMREEAQAGRTVLFATHYLEEADEIADRVIVLHRGRVLADGTAAAIKAKAGQRRVTFELDALDGPDAVEGPRALDALVTPGGPRALDALVTPGGPRALDALDTPGAPRALDGLRSLPHLTGLEVSGRTVRLRSRDADATVHALYGLGLYPRNLEVTGLGLEQAFIAITEEAGR
ncbi:ABC transporter ATP-binding protein [Streptomyces sp. NPDC047108]|uniref:ABC transporter ATP-binding protein n=1 Tax=Streptomyces sp. NPDC047108 TaxID=3155025 RepID=UPI0033F509C1